MKRYYEAMPDPTENLRRMNLQLFAGTTEDSDSGDGDDVENQDDSGESEDEQNEKAGRKSFTDEELSKFVARSTKKAMAKFMKDIGLAPDSDAAKVKARLAALGRFEDDQKDDLGKAKGDLDTANGELAKAKAAASSAMRSLLAIKTGVPADKVDRYVKLAESYMDGEDDDDDAFVDAVKSALKDFPAAQTERRGSAGAGANPGAGATKKTELNAGQEAAQRRKDQLKRSQDALKHYSG